MKLMIRTKIEKTLSFLACEGRLPGFSERPPVFVVEEPRDPDHGHLAVNVALVLAKSLGRKPRDLAREITDALTDPDGFIEKMDIAGPGFINFTLSPKWWASALERILAAGPAYGRGQPNGRRVQVEFVSANPTGPLHIGHGRGAAIGDALARILSFVGYEVSSEYYINDAGRQMRILGESVLTRLEQLTGRDVVFPENHYQGQYIADLAREILTEKGLELQGMEREALVTFLSRKAQDSIMDGIKADLADFKVIHNVWFAESSLYAERQVEKALDLLREKGHLYEKDGALWFHSEAFGDDRDRVLIKSSGDPTYFTGDIAYHLNKYQRGFDLAIDVLGADHHGYLPRMEAAVQALGYQADQYDVVLVQLVNLLRGGQPVAMSTRAGEFVTLREVIDEVGPDAARFIFLTRSSDSSLDFDLELAKTQTKDNPVYYVQYVGARINSIKGNVSKSDPGRPADLSLLVQPEEVFLIKHLSAFPETLDLAAQKREPHHLAAYLTSLARLFHHYYGRHRVVVEDEGLADARLALIEAVRRVVKTGLSLLGVSSPDAM